MPGPMAPRARPGRLGGLRGPPPPRKRAPAKPAAPSAPTCPNQDCPGPDIVEEDGMLVCKGCYTQIARSDIVAEVTFEENAGGRATVQGGTVNDNSRHARTLGAGAYRKVGGGERNTLADIQTAGRRALENLCPQLGISEHIQMQAIQLWVLASHINFSAGRRTDEVAAACLYAACRRHKDNKILLMDIAELISINVFRLGEVYKDMCKELYMNDQTVGQQHLVELEPLIFKYCDKLQFAEKTKDVAEDALKIIRRMNRDYIVSGRHPAGLCGACIILAARMNNFQRTVREVVFVSKVADITIAKRVEEFRRTKSSGLSIEDFRKYANKIKHQHDPPSSFAQEAAQRKYERQRARRDEHMQMKELRESQVRESQRLSQPISIPDDATDASSRLSSLEPGTAAPEVRIQTQAPEAPMVAPAVQSPADTPVMDKASASSETTQGPNKRKIDVSGQYGNEAPSENGGPHKRQRTETSLSDGTFATPPPTQQSNKRNLDEAQDAANATENSTQGREGPSKRQRTDASPFVEPGQTAQPSTTASGLGSLLRYDADGFAIPAIPVARPPVPSQPEESPEPPVKRGRGRPKKQQPPEIVISEEELAEEDYLEKQIEEALENGELQESQTEVEKLKEEERIEMEKQRAAQLALQQQKIDLEKSKAAREARGINYFGDTPEWNPGEALTAEDLEAEFANDPEVANCLLSEAEVKIKEQIWVAHNEDWLRKQAERDMMAEVAKATGGDKRGGKSKNHKARGKKRSKMGDGTVLTESSTPIETPADAAKAMLEKRAPMKSAHVDFSALQRIYGRDAPSRSSSTTPDTSAAQTPAAGSRVPSVAPIESSADAGISAAGSPEVDDDDDDDEENAPDAPRVPKPLEAPDWNNINLNSTEAAQDDEEEEDDEDFDRAAGIGQVAVDEDEFGVIEGFDDDYEDGYEEY